MQSLKVAEKGVGKCDEEVKEKKGYQLICSTSKSY